MAQGTVKWFNTQKGYGFINPDEDGNDVFVHITAVQNSGLTGLNEGQRFSYELAEQRNGRFAAVDLSIVD
ncbi:MAG: cold-shock protein [Pseudomonadota bacterium]|nr:cold-shock protein [Pseudomonadota bacterium]